MVFLIEWVIVYLVEKSGRWWDVRLNVRGKVVGLAIQPFITFGKYVRYAS